MSILNRTRTREYKGWIHKGLEWTPSNPEGDEFQRMLSEKGELILTCRGRDIYRLNFNLEGAPCCCFLYIFRNTSLTRALKTSYAYQTLRISNTIRELGFPSIEVLAAIRPKNEILNWNSLLIAKEILNVKELPATGSHIYKVHASIPFSGEVADLTASELARFHDSSLFHGDLKSRHILISKNPDKESRDIWFVDLEKTRRHKLLPSFLRDILAARDLVQLLSSLPGDNNGDSAQEEKSRFLSLYLSNRNLSRKRSGTIKKAVNLYLESGSLRQGETLLQGIYRRIRERVSGGTDDGKQG